MPDKSRTKGSELHLIQIIQLKLHIRQLPDRMIKTPNYAELIVLNLIPTSSGAGKINTKKHLTASAV